MVPLLRDKAESQLTHLLINTTLQNSEVYIVALIQVVLISLEYIMNDKICSNEFQLWNITMTIQFTLRVDFMLPSFIYGQVIIIIELLFGIALKFLTINSICCKYPVK